MQKIKVVIMQSNCIKLIMTPSIPSKVAIIQFKIFKIIVLYEYLSCKNFCWIVSQYKIIDHQC